MGRQPLRSVDNLVSDLDQFQVGNVEGSDRFDRLVEHLAAASSIGGSHLAPELSKLAQHPGSIEALALTVFAKAHRGCPAYFRLSFPT